MRAFTVVPSRSGVLRPPAEREVLNLFGARMAAVTLSGFIFFGSSLSISDQVNLADFLGASGATSDHQNAQGSSPACKRQCTSRQEQCSACYLRRLLVSKGAS